MYAPITNNIIVVSFYSAFHVFIVYSGFITLSVYCAKEAKCDRVLLH